MCIFFYYYYFFFFFFHGGGERQADAEVIAESDRHGEQHCRGREREGRGGSFAVAQPISQYV